MKMMSIFHNNSTPHITSVTLKVPLFQESIEFYKDVIGLDILETFEEKIILGSNGRKMLTLKETKTSSDFNEGLYHIAFLLPTEKDLANWLTKQIKRKTLFVGASNHIVSKAIYLEDPNGFGIEVYADTLKEKWKMINDQIHMDTLPLDVNGLLQLSDNNPVTDIIIGHMHLRERDLNKAKTFYSDLGMSLMLDMGSAKFMSFNGYHHHLGLNQWGKNQMKPFNADSGLQEMDIHYPIKDFIEVTNSSNRLLAKLDETHYITFDPIGIKINILQNKGEQKDE